MKILVTGAKGFVGRNLCAWLNNIKEGKVPGIPFTIEEVMECDVDTSTEQLEDWCRQADFVFNLAGVNRPKDNEEFKIGNCGFLSLLLTLLEKHGNKAPVMLSSSTQALLDNPYGESKRMAEDTLMEHCRKCDSRGYIYRFPNLFGKWCRPNYNSVVATFCHNIANDLPISISDKDVSLRLVYIDDLLDEMTALLEGCPHLVENGFFEVPVSHEISLGELADTIAGFTSLSGGLGVPDLTGGGLERKLYATYLSYLPKEKIAYPLKMNSDERGSFTELIRTKNAGQISVNVSRPGITKGEHWHNSKNERFIVVKGHGRIQLRKEGTDEIISFDVDGGNPQVVQLLPGYTHNLINLSETEDMITLIWVDEVFDPTKPDTYYDPVVNIKNKE